LPLPHLSCFPSSIEARWGLENTGDRRKPGGGKAQWNQVTRYVILLMFIGGGLAGLAGMSEVSAIQGRLRPSLSPGYGYIVFLGVGCSAKPLGIVAGTSSLPLSPRGDIPPDGPQASGLGGETS